MPAGKHEVMIDLPIESVWNFVKDMDHWAPLLPGYISHEKMNEEESEWYFHETVGFMKKKIGLHVTIQEWIEPEKVTFVLEGINENITGNGYFLAERMSPGCTKMTGFLEMEAHGALAPVMNGVMKNSLPRTGRELTKAIAEKLGSHS